MTVNGDNRVAFVNIYNNMGTGYRVVDDEVTLGMIRSMKIACPESQVSFDTTIVATVQGKYSISKGANKSPVLTITNANQVDQFKAISK